MQSKKFLFFLIYLNFNFIKIETYFLEKFNFCNQ